MNTQTLEQMKQLRFYGMHRAFSETLQAGSVQYTNDELIAHLMQSEWDDRYNRKIERLTKAAKFRYRAIIENINYDLGSNVGILNNIKFLCSNNYNILVAVMKN